ncbi:protein CPR-5 [Cornus florida]|uniref:protein CPR-5 n=1 Tax=Cornus florida TaxID=4283 RepID=UPI00289B01F0|nr:protein CPR-5 [Cornus florida]
MDDPSPSLQSLQSSPPIAATQTDHPPIAAVDQTSNSPNPTVESPRLSKSTIDAGKPTVMKKKKKKQKPHIVDGSDLPPSSSSSSCCCSSHSTQRGFRISSTRRNPRVLIGSVRQRESDVEAIALPLGMSIAAVVAQVLEKTDATGERMSVHHLSRICSLAVRESLANVFGDKFDCFVRNFEKSFRSTLMTLRLINESSQSEGGELLRHLRKENYCSHVSPPMSLNTEGDSACNSGVKDCQSEAVPHAISTQEGCGTLEETEENIHPDLLNRELALLDGQRNQQLTCVSPSTLQSVMSQSVIEQARSNYFKRIEISLSMKKLKLKEEQLSLKTDSNLLERFKLSLGISNASFKAEKFKNQLEDTRHAELLRTCMDCLVAGLFVMLGSLAYGAYVYSPKRITEATVSCTPTMESKSSWWIPKPMASVSSGFQVLSCQAQVVSRMLFGMLMILAIAYLLIQRSGTSQQTMPVTFIVLLLGGACGFAGKICIDTLGGSGYHWLVYWEALCLLHFFSNVFISILFLFLNGPIAVSPGAKGDTIFPYWIRRFLFYTTVLLLLPLACGLVPFASLVEWKDHFFSLIIDYLPSMDD